jgi:hypothetical protein
MIRKLKQQILLFIVLSQGNILNFQLKDQEQLFVIKKSFMMKLEPFDQ